MQNLSTLKTNKFTCAALFFAAAICFTQGAEAGPNKCVGKDGKVEYTDGPCKVGAVQKELKAKPVQVMKNEAITGQAAKPKDDRPQWLKDANETLDPVAKCKKRGGTIDPEFRACKLP